MKNLILSGLVLMLASVAQAKGGMIGGGDVTFKSLMVCDAASIDPTHTSSPYVWVVKEVDYNGKFIADANLRVVTLNAAMKPVRYYVTHVRGLNSRAEQIAFDLWRYDQGSTRNDRIGDFQWDAQENSGALRSLSDADQVEELVLSNCILTP